MAGISIALCTYNGERFLTQQLDSILMQNRLPDEIIVCDDDSADRTLEILGTFQQQAIVLGIPVTLRQNAHNLGVAKNFEQAIQLCRGDYIALADQDDVWEPDKLAILAEALDHNPDVGLVFSDAQVVSENLEPMPWTLWETLRFSRREQKRMSAGQQVDILLKHQVVTGAATMFRSGFIPKLMPIQETWIHDAWISLIIALYARLIPIRKELIQYRQHTHNQVGALQNTPKWLVANARLRGRDHYRSMMEQYQLAFDHIATLNSVPDHKQVLEKLHQKISHLRHRANLSPNRLRRIYPTLREICIGHYARYSGGRLSILKDLLLPN